MKSRLPRRSLLFAAVALGVITLQTLSPGQASRAPGALENTSGDPEQVLRSYQTWAATHEQAGGDRQVEVPLGWSKALSAIRSEARGTARLELTSGRVLVELSGLVDEADVWLVDNQEVPNDTVAPEPHDHYRRLGTLIPQRGSARLAVDLGAQAFRDFDVDLVVVTASGRTPSTSGMLFGAPTLFQRLYHRQQRLRAGLDEVPAPPAAPAAMAALFSLLRPVARASGNILVDQGRQLFVNGTFGGNGRTCASCHPASNNFTIDPTFIASLPPTDPLFVAERRPELAALENPQLMRKVGLILENVDGFDRPGVMRSVPHTFALRTSLTPAVFDQTTKPPHQRTGWGGDGAPGGGTLRDFAVGAVTQHFPRTLARVNGVDFRLPTDAELDAMEAFQLSLGRQADLDLVSLNFRNPVVQLGKRIFNNGGATPDATIAQGKCSQCHGNAGANTGGANANFNTGVVNLPAQPADLIDPDHNPPDGGFGQTQGPDGSFGLGSFNTPPLVEAADTGPFFHNNAIETIEEAVNFYNSDAFQESPSGQFLQGIKLAATEVVAVSAFLRVVNAAENIRQSTDEASRALGRPHAEARLRLTQSTEELKDALEVVRGGKLHPLAVNNLAVAIAYEAAAYLDAYGPSRDNLIRLANQRKAAARADMIQ
jgi:mono/diheme cytochrome c family protein